jgi:hypothetical protein
MGLQHPGDAADILQAGGGVISLTNHAKISVTLVCGFGIPTVAVAVRDFRQRISISGWTKQEIMACVTVQINIKHFC